MLAFCGLMAGTLSTNAQARQKTKVKTKTAQGDGIAASIASGKQIYIKNCLTCHQADGGGVQRMNPPLIKTEYVSGDKARLINIILKGFNEDVEINGQYYTNVMPPLNTLKDQEIADVLTYVRNSFGNKNSAVSLGEVKKARLAK